MTWIPILIVSGVFIGIPLIVTERNAKYLISGYNTMSEKEREQFDLKGYLPFMKKVLIPLGVVVLVQALVFQLMGKMHFAIFGMLLLLLTIVPIFVIKSQKFDHNKKGATRTTAYVVATICLVILIGIIVGFYYSTRPNEIDITEKHVVITGSYGTQMAIDDIDTVYMVTDLPTIKMKVNGFAAGGYSKGKFRSSEGIINLYQSPDSEDYLKITTSQGNYFWGGTETQVKQKLELLLRD